jgi:hypothetical protein
MATKQHARSCGAWAGCERDHGDCSDCGVSLADRIAMSFGGNVWLCESCYIGIRDRVDQAVDALEATRD